MNRILGSIRELQIFLKKSDYSGIYLVTSRPLAKKLAWAIKEIGILRENVFFIPDGEAAKEWKELEKLLHALRRKNVDRNSIVLAFGGGTVGDMVGFATSIYLRGIRYIQIPTTLVAQVDSAHGGKTAINFHTYKNQIGTFYYPEAIVIDPRFLSTLRNEQVVDGLGEIIKYGVIKDRSVLALLRKENIKTLLQSKRLPEIIKKSIRVKLHYTHADPGEKNLRQLLNFGHTIGHALELKYKISHGRAVLIGMLMELEITESLGYTAISVRKNVSTLLHTLGVSIDLSLEPDLSTILADKKVSGSELFLPVAIEEGKAKVVSLSAASFIKQIKKHDQH